jgi:hypothetical protein
MFIRGSSFEWLSASNHPSAPIGRLGGWRASVGALALVSVLSSAACTGSPPTLAQPPDFEVKTSGGIAGVGIRGSLPGVTDSEFVQLVRTGMGRAAPGSVLPGPVELPFPECRIVWHVNPSAEPGVSTLVANIFDRSVPVAYEQETVTNNAPTSTVTYAIESVTDRLMASYSILDANASSQGCHPSSG